MTPKSPTDVGLLFFFIKRHLPMGVGKINSFFEFLFTFLDISYLFLQIFFWILSWQCILNVQELFLFLFPFFLVSCSYFRVQDLSEYLWEYKFCFLRLDISSWLRKIFIYLFYLYFFFILKAFLNYLVRTGNLLIFRKGDEDTDMGSLSLVNQLSLGLAGKIQPLWAKPHKHQEVRVGLTLGCR